MFIICVLQTIWVIKIYASVYLLYHSSSKSKTLFRKYLIFLQHQKTFFSLNYIRYCYPLNKIKHKAIEQLEIDMNVIKNRVYNYVLFFLES